jgi:hypothetical protein
MLLAAGKPTFSGRGHQLDPGEVGRHHLGAAVAGGAIDDDDLHGNGVTVRRQGEQAATQQLAHVPADDDDGEILLHGHIIDPDQRAGWR